MPRYLEHAFSRACEFRHKSGPEAEEKRRTRSMSGSGREGATCRFPGQSKGPAGKAFQTAKPTFCAPKPALDALFVQLFTFQGAASRGGIGKLQKLSHRARPPACYVRILLWIRPGVGGRRGNVPMRLTVTLEGPEEIVLPYAHNYLLQAAIYHLIAQPALKDFSFTSRVFSWAKGNLSSYLLPPSGPGLGGSRPPGHGFCPAAQARHLLASALSAAGVGHGPSVPGRTAPGRGQARRADRGRNGSGGHGFAGPGAHAFASGRVQHPDRRRRQVHLLLFAL